MAQIFVQKDSLVSDVYHAFLQAICISLEDNIRFRGAMSKLISDYAQVEISNKVKDILRMYHSTSWHSEPYHRNQNISEWTIGPSRHGPTPSSTGQEHLPTVGCSA